MPRAPRLSILLAIACALFLRALVPAGWMPAPNAGVFAIQPCPAADSANSVHAAGHRHHGKAGHDPSHGAAHNGDCAFSPFMAGFADLGAAPSLPATAIIAVAPSQPSASTLATGPPALPPPSTGPPASA